jgi:AMP nucleosidase
MELATLFSVAYHYEVPIGSIMLVSDMPLQKRGIKDKNLYNRIYAEYMETHLDIALDAAAKINTNWRLVAQKLSSEW